MRHTTLLLIILLYCATSAAAQSLKLEPCNVPDLQDKGQCGNLEVFENRATRTGRKINLNSKEPRHECEDDPPYGIRDTIERISRWQQQKVESRGQYTPTEFDIGDWTFDICHLEGVFRVFLV